MARDVQIRMPASDAPGEYTVPNATEIQPLAINATFVGTGAASPFRPTVEIVSDGGVVVARVPCQTTVAAGDSAEVTFAPFLRVDAAAATTKNIFYAKGIDSGGTAATGTPVTVKIGTFETNDGSSVALDFVGTPTDQIVLVSSSYIYTVTCVVHWNSFVGDRTMTLTTSVGEPGWFYPFTTTTADDVQILTAVCWPEASVPTNLVATLEQATGSSQTWTSVTMLVEAFELNS